MASILERLNKEIYREISTGVDTEVAGAEGNWGRKISELFEQQSGI